MMDKKKHMDSLLSMQIVEICVQSNKESKLDTCLSRNLHVLQPRKTFPKFVVFDDRSAV